MSSVALWKEARFRSYKSLKMSRGRKMSLGSVWRLLLARERCVKDFNPLKVNLERPQISLFSMKLEKMRTCLSYHSESQAIPPAVISQHPRPDNSIGARDRLP